MAQTLYALIAYFSLMFFTVNQYRNAVTVSQDRVHDELEVIAAEMALQTLDHIEGFPFDAATASPGFRHASFDEADLAAYPFAGTVAFEAADVLEEFDQTHTRTPFQTPDMGEPLTFDVCVTVRYITDAGAFSAVPTDTKEVVVTVTHEQYLENPDAPCATYFDDTLPPEPYLARLRRSYLP